MRMGIHLLLACLAMPCAWAHNDAAPPETDSGLTLGLQAALAHLSAPQALPSQGLPGYLLQGDAGLDARGTSLEHAVVYANYRFAPDWLAQFALGAHDSDPAHVETAWLQTQGRMDGLRWTLGAGRNSPSLGDVIGSAGHFDRFGRMPLAKQAWSNGDWIEDGSEWGAKGQHEGMDWALDVGVWTGSSFPGASASRAFPSVHLGLQSAQNAWGSWAVDGFVAPMDVSARASRIASTTGAHSHSAPACDEAMNGVVCFDGRAVLSGVSVQWRAANLPLTLQAALLWRNEQGTLQSRNGLGQYEGRNQGDWLEAIWHLQPQWDITLRHEQLNAQHYLAGAGARLLASEAGLDNYSPLRRTSFTTGYRVFENAELRLEAGQENSSTHEVAFVAVRMLLTWEGR